MKATRALAASFLALACAFGAAASPARPLPAEERLTYARTRGGRRDEVRMRLSLEERGGAARYLLVVESPDQEGSYELDPETLLPLKSDVRTREEGITLRTVTTIEENRLRVGPDEILVSGMESMAQAFRAYPWEERRQARLVFAGAPSRGGPFSFELSLAGTETVEAAGRRIECWKLQLGMGGLLGSLFGKSSFWYSKAYPHVLVKSESPAAGPSPATSMILLSYSSSPAGGF